MTVKLQGKSSQCEFRGLGSACGTCFSTGSTRCSFELNPEEVGLMVNELFKPWQSLTLSCMFFILFCLNFPCLLTSFILDLTRLTGQIALDSSRLQRLMPLVAELESSLIQSTRELQSACEGIFESGSAEQISYLFTPPSLLESLANFDLAALDRMDATLVASKLLPGTAPAPAPPVEHEINVPQAGPSTSATPASPTFVMEPIPVDDTDMEHPSFEVLRQSSPAPEIPAEEEEPEEDELAMSGVEDAAEDIVGDEVKGADEF